jgi:hypothetical protein
VETHPTGGTPVTRRQWVIDALCEAFARDQLELHELERRLEEANRARTDGELRALLQGIDVGGADVKAVVAAGPAPSTATPGTGVRRAEASQVPDRQLTLAVWSGRSRKGTWIPARRISAIAFQGGIELDFRDARFGPGVTHVRAVAVMGAVEITVPPEIHVDTSGFALMGAFEDDADTSSAAAGDSPVLRVTGFACMGAVEVKVRLPGETDRQARERHRRKRRALKDARE